MDVNIPVKLWPDFDPLALLGTVRQVAGSRNASEWRGYPGGSLVMLAFDCNTTPAIVTVRPVRDIDPATVDSYPLAEWAALSPFIEQTEAATR